MFSIFYFRIPKNAAVLPASSSLFSVYSGQPPRGRADPAFHGLRRADERACDFDRGVDEPTLGIAICGASRLSHISGEHLSETTQFNIRYSLPSCVVPTIIFCGGLMSSKRFLPCFLTGASVVQRFGRQPCRRSVFFCHGRLRFQVVHRQPYLAIVLSQRLKNVLHAFTLSHRKKKVVV